MSERGAADDGEVIEIASNSDEGEEEYFSDEGETEGEYEDEVEGDQAMDDEEHQDEDGDEEGGTRAQWVRENISSEGQLDVMETEDRDVLERIDHLDHDSLGDYAQGEHRSDDEESEEETNGWESDQLLEPVMDEEDAEAEDRENIQDHVRNDEANADADHADGDYISLEVASHSGRSDASNSEEGVAMNTNDADMETDQPALSTIDLLRQRVLASRVRSSPESPLALNPAHAPVATIHIPLDRTPEAPTSSAAPQNSADMAIGTLLGPSNVTTSANTIPVTTSPSRQLNRRILDAVKLPQLEDSLKSLVGSVPGFDVFMQRIDQVLTAIPDETDLKGKQISIETASRSDPDGFTAQTSGGQGKPKEVLDMEFEDLAHSLEQETRKLRQDLNQARALALTQQENIGSGNIQSSAGLREALEKRSRENAELKAALSLLESDKRNLSLVVNNKMQETAFNLREIDSLRRDLTSLRTENHRLQEAATSATTTTAQLSLDLLTAQQTAESSKQNTAFLTQELARKTQQYESYRANKSSAVNNLQMDLDAALADKQALSTRLSQLQNRYTAQEERLSKALASLHESQESATTDKLAFKNDMEAQKRLLAVYNTQVESLNAQLSENKNLLAEAQNGLDALIVSREASEKRAQELETAMKEKESKLVDLEKRIRVFDEQVLESIHSEDISAISPAAQAAQALQKSGKTFTQVYMEYIALKDDNKRLKSDVAHLTENLNDVLNDLNERAPEIKKLSSDKKLVEEEVQRLFDELEKSEALRLEAQDFTQGSKQEIETLTARNGILEQETHDLSRQVQHLLVQLEHQKSGVFSPSPLPRTSSPRNQSNQSPSNRIISDRLVLFDNIVQLQSQNQQLRSSLRTVSEALAKLERTVETSVEEKVEQELEESVRILEEVREQLRVANARCETLGRENEELQLALEESRGGISGFGGIMPGTPRAGAGGFSRPATPMGGAGRVSGAFSGQVLQAVQVEYDEYKLATSTDLKKLRESHANLQSEKGNLEIQVARLQTAIENMKERNASLLDRIDSSKLEVEHLQSQITRHLQHQSATNERLSEVSAQLAQTRASIDTQSAEVRLLRTEKESLVVKEATLSAEKVSLSQQLADVKQQVAHVQQQLQNSESEKKEKLMSGDEKMRGMEVQVELVRAQLSATQEDVRARSLRYEASMSDARYQIEKLTAELAEAVRTREVSKVEERRLQQSCRDLQSRLTAAEQRAEHLQDSLNETLTSPESVLLREARAEIARLSTDLETSQRALESQKADVEQYRAIASSSEAKLAERLSEFNETYDRFKTEMEQRVHAAQEEKSRQEVAKNEAEMNLRTLTQSSSRDIQRLESECAILSNDKRSSEEHVARLQNAEIMAQTAIQSLNDELATLQARLVESREAYERIVKAEAERIHEVDKLKRELKNSRGDCSRLNEKIVFVESDLDAKEQLWESTKTQLDQEIASLKKTNEDLITQNKILHNQFEQISSRLSGSDDAAESSELSLASPSSTLQESERERLELIRHLRRDKDSVTQEYEICKQNLERFQKQTQQLQTLLDETRANLENERKSNQVAGEMEALHKELLSKIDRVSVLTESNSTLRHNNNVMARKLESLETRLREREAENTPLKEQNNSLLAEIEAFKGQVNHLQTENAKLIGRASEILGKYNRVDPAEHQSLKDEIVSLKASLEKAESDVSAATGELEALRKSSESQIVLLSGQVMELKEALDAAKAEMSTQKTAQDAFVKAEKEKMKAVWIERVERGNTVIKDKNIQIGGLKSEIEILKASELKLKEENVTLAKLSSTFETEKFDWANTNKKLEDENTKLHSQLGSALTSAPQSALASEKLQETVTSFEPNQGVSNLKTQLPPIPLSPSPSTKRSREEEASKISPIRFEEPAVSVVSETPEPKRIRVEDLADGQGNDESTALNPESEALYSATTESAPVNTYTDATSAPSTTVNVPSAAAAPATTASSAEADTTSQQNNQPPATNPTPRTDKSALNSLLAKKMAALRPMAQSPQLTPEIMGTAVAVPPLTINAPTASAQPAGSTSVSGGVSRETATPAPSPMSTADKPTGKPVVKLSSPVGAPIAKPRPISAPGPETLPTAGAATPRPSRPRPYATNQVRVLGQPMQPPQYQNVPGSATGATGRPIRRPVRTPSMAAQMGGVRPQGTPTGNVIAGNIRPAGAGRPRPRPPQNQ
ncbi:hypothetical protein HDU81_008427 [Chytriomyces hyalinus]|nr:hypothetical protein HDU81_008427 [Chytriomyces hyalinus]